jgi:ribosome-associated heat shock protein Hsp15
MPIRVMPMTSGQRSIVPRRERASVYDAQVPDSAVSESPLRLDVWLDVACLCKTRSEAQKAVKGGKVEVNGERPKQNREVKPGDTITLTRPLGRKQVVRVLATCEQHLPKAEAKALLYEDITPPPTPEELAFLQLLKDTRPRGPLVAPDKRERRELRRLKGRA